MVCFAKSKGIADIMVPKTILKVDAIPLLGTGKVDLKGAQDLGARLMNVSADEPVPLERFRVRWNHLMDQISSLG